MKLEEEPKDSGEEVDKDSDMDHSLFRLVDHVAEEHAIHKLVAEVVDFR